MELVVRILGDLERAGLILQDEESGKLVPLTLGKIASFYYLKYQTMVVFSERLKPDATAQDLLEVLSNAKEYEELPVRHNEDRMNAELNSAMRWPVDTASFDSPFTKTHLLLEAHFSRLELPISDYYTDLKSVLDQSIRVLQAMVDTTAEAGWLGTTLNAMNLMQMVVQGRWADDSTLLNLPAVQNNEKLRHGARPSTIVRRPFHRINHRAVTCRPSAGCRHAATGGRRVAGLTGSR
jgi:activating signal cointegrator complex subunit 3